MKSDLNPDIDFKILFENSDVGIVHHNSKGYIDFANQAAEELLGLSLEQMQGKHSIDPDWKAIHKDGTDFPGETHPAMITLKTGEKVQNQVMGVYHSKNRNYIWLIVSSFPEFNESGQNPTGVFASFIDITKQIKAEKNLSYQTKLQDLLMRISTEYINIPLHEFDRTVQKSLEEIGKFLKADRSYIFDYDFENMTTSNTYEWCAAGIQPEIDNLQDVPIDAIPEWVNTHLSGKPLIIKDVLSLNKDNNVRQILEPQDVKSLITVPIYSDNECVGFVGLDSVSSHFLYTKNDAKLLNVFSNLLATVKKRFKDVKELDENRRFLSDIIQNTGSIIAIKNLEGKYILTNKQWNESLGMNEKEVIGKTDFDLFPEKTAELFRKNDLKTLNSLQIEKFEEKIITKDGVRYFLSTKFPVKDNEGSVTGVCAMVTEITQIKKTEKELEANKTYLENLVNSQTSFVIRTDLNGFKTYSNNKFEEEHGWLFKKRENGKVKATDSICPYHHNRTEKTVKKCIEHPGKTITVELDKPSKNGGVRTTLWEFTCLTDNKGAPSEIQCIGFDITKRKKAEEKLKENERKYRIIFESTNDAKFITKNGTIYDCNKAAGKLLSSEKSEIIGNKTLDFSPILQDNGSKSVDLFQKISSKVKQGESVQFQWKLQSPKKEKIYSEVTLVPLSLEGEQYLLETWRDITDKIQAENDRIARKEAEASSKAKSRFLSNMSHEIRTPLHAIIGFSQLLEKDEELTTKQGKQINSISRSSQHLLRLIDDVLDYSKIEAGKMDVKPSSFKISNLTRDLEAIFSLKASKKGVQFIINTSKDLPDSMISDENKVRQILVNLIGNALKYTDHGSVSLHISIVNSFKNKEKSIEFSVEDTGIGISRENLKHIFSEFKQFKTTSIEGGTGLGLPISKKLANLLNGDICIESEEGTGTKVTLKLPYTSYKSKNDASTNSEQNADDHRKKLKEINPSIMVIEDNDDIQQTISDMLESANITPHLYSSGTAAINDFKKLKPDLVLLDLKLPDMTGYSVAKNLQDISKQKANIIAMSAAIQPSSKRGEQIPDFRDYLQKPFTHETLLKTMLMNMDIYRDSDSHSLLNQVDKAAKVPDISVLSNNTIENVIAAVERGNKTKLEMIADGFSEKYPDISKYLAQLTENFKYDEILNWFNTDLHED